jgi:hypothetical protein
MNEDVALLGTAASLSLARVPSKLIHANYLRASSFESYIGNDAVIASLHLVSRGVKPQLFLLAPSSCDVQLILESASAAHLNITRLSERENAAVTRSVCVEGQDGGRLWVVQAVDHSSVVVPPIDNRLLYVDIYDETEDLLVKWLQGRTHRGRQSVLANVSSSRVVDKARGLSGASVDVLQASADNLPALSSGELIEFADELRKLSGAGVTVVTAGARGAAFVSASERGWVCSERHVQGVSLGAGAVYSAELLLAMASGLAPEDMAKRASDQTAEALSVTSLWRRT